MQKKIPTALLWSALLLVTIVPFSSCVQNTKPSEPAADLSFKDTPFVQETHTAFPVGKEQEDNEVRSIAVDQKQNIWIATAGGIFEKPAGSSSWDPVITGVDRGPAYTVAVNAAGTIMLGTWNGLYTYREGVLRKEEGPQPPISVITTRDADTYALGPHGIWHFVSSKWELQNYKIARSVRDAALDKRGALWVATDAGLYRLREGNIDLYQDTTELISCYAKALSFAPAGDLWQSSSRSSRRYCRVAQFGR